MIAWLTIGAILLATSQTAKAQAGADTLPLTPAAFAAVKASLEYDRAIPLDAALIETTEFPTHSRQRIVYRGWRSRLPAYLALPKTGEAPFPVVLLVHGGGSSKETWWQGDGFEFGAALRDSLLSAGFAILAIDTQLHGERAAAADYMPVPTMFLERKWMHRLRDVTAETSVDLRRALDYLETRADIDVRRASVLGTSMGGSVAALVAATDDRIRAAVIGVAPVEEKRFYPFRPLDIAPGLRRPATLIVAGRADEMIPMAATERFMTAVGGPRSKLVILNSGHSLPAEYIVHSIQWLRAHGR
ncbi:MAG TPA: alpha/beta fold hydrolase [Gemmatimonadaceae bacterium]